MGTIGDDPRLDPRLRSFLADLGMAGTPPAPPVSREDGVEAVAAQALLAEAAIEARYRFFVDGWSGPPPTVRYRIDHATADDGHAVALHIFEPSHDGSRPAVVYLHGGGMTLLRADNDLHLRWCSDVAARGVTVIAVEFRGPLGGIDAGFPRGLEDCFSALQWLDAHRATLGVTGIVVQGESGGANLALAVTMLAKRRGFASLIAGAYAMVPYISGAYGWPEHRRTRELPSLTELDGYYITCAGMDLLVHLYDPSGANAENPLCWPHFATDADLRGLPPHVISVNELDPLKDEGLRHARRLAAVGNHVYARINAGIPHAADLTFARAIPDVYEQTVADVATFAQRMSEREHGPVRG